MSLKRDERTFLLLEIGKRIKEFRMLKELTQIEFAKEMGIDYKNLPKIEKGERGLTETMLYNLIIYFPDFDPIYILTGKKKEVETAPTEGVENEL